MRRVCPAEVTGALPARAATPDGITIDAAETVLAWIGQRFAREDELERRLLDAKEECEANG